jgi:hypothetical protein
MEMESAKLGITGNELKEATRPSELLNTMETGETKLYYWKRGQLNCWNYWKQWKWRQQNSYYTHLLIHTVRKYHLCVSPTQTYNVEREFAHTPREFVAPIFYTYTRTK